MIQFASEKLWVENPLKTVYQISCFLISVLSLPWQVLNQKHRFMSYMRIVHCLLYCTFTRQSKKQPRFASSICKKRRPPCRARYSQGIPKANNQTSLSDSPTRKVTCTMIAYPGDFRAGIIFTLRIPRVENRG